MLHQTLEQSEIHNSLLGLGNKTMQQVVAQTTDLTLGANGASEVNVNATSTNISVLLPPEAAGISRTITNTSSGTAVLTVKDDSGVTSFATLGPGQSAVFRSNGTTWYTSAITGGGSGVVVTTATQLTVSAAAHAGKRIRIDSAAPIAVSMPVATGSGNAYEFYIGVVATATSHTIAANGTDIIQGVAWVSTTSTDNAEAFATTATSDKLSANGTTTGGIVGDVWVWVDIKANTWNVQGYISQTGNTATPFSQT